MTATAAVELEGLARSYGERPALSGVTLRLAPGETLAVLGRNGAGKSTLLAVLATLLRPHAGKVAVLGRSLPDEGWAVRGRIGLMSHDPMLYRDLTARENLDLHARLHGVGRERGAELLEQVGMAGRADEPVRNLSRGMAQRVAACRAVLHDPELLLLDEPTAHLDPSAVALLAPLVGAGATRAGGTPRARVVSSHDPWEAISQADVVLGLRDGRVLLVGRAGDVDPEALGALYA
jgi:ABC-type multidrug transport system ATPase subunit